jgi:pimeloyl-ACP methyl ester carboxylesterase
VLRTPDERFAVLTGRFAEYVPKYVELKDGLRMAYLDEGPKDAKDTVLLLHGEPTYSYLYRKMIEPLVLAGHRVIVPDLIGFGRSDKPTDPEAYTYHTHMAWLTEFVVESLDLQDITPFLQDWGSLLGLCLVTQHPDRFSRVVLGNGHLISGSEVPFKAQQQMPAEYAAKVHASFQAKLDDPNWPDYRVRRLFSFRSFCLLTFIFYCSLRRGSTPLRMPMALSTDISGDSSRRLPLSSMRPRWSGRGACQASMQMQQQRTMRRFRRRSTWSAPSAFRC